MIDTRVHWFCIVRVKIFYVNYTCLSVLLIFLLRENDRYACTLVLHCSRKKFLSKLHVFIKVVNSIFLPRENDRYAL